MIRLPMSHSDQTYIDWKKWGAPTDFGPAEISIWTRLHRAAGIQSGHRLVELGFGSGTHLAFCKSRGIDAVGVETNEACIARAQAAGLSAVSGELSAQGWPSASVDAVVAFDVIEHLDLRELTAFLTEVKRLLKKDGRLLLTFPNGASPMGRYLQHGDLTHRRAYNRLSIEQLCAMTGYEIIHFADMPEHMPLATPLQWVKWAGRQALRGINRLLMRAYFDHPLGLSIACVLKPSAPPARG